ADRGDVGAFKSDLGEAILRDLHGGACMLHLPTQSLHLRNREPGIMSNDDALGGLENLAKGRDLLSFCRAFHQLSPVGGPYRGTAGLMLTPLGTTVTSCPRPSLRPTGHRGLNRRACPALYFSPVYAGSCDLSRFRRRQSRTGTR